VKGRANGYWRVNGQSLVLENDTTIELSELGTSSATSRPEIPKTKRPSDLPVELAETAAAGGEEGLRALAQLVQLASTGGEGFIDPTPLVEGILNARVDARAKGQYELADELRNVMANAGVEVKDTPEGTAWSIKTTN
jgi:cysteinyl-tRNA synthetase